MHQESNFTYTSPQDPSDPPQLPFPEPSVIPARPTPATTPSMPALSMNSDAAQLPFPDQPANNSIQVPFPQPLPSTESIDTAEIRFMQLLPVSMETETGETDVQLPFPQQSLPGMEEIMRIPQAPQMPLPPQPSRSGTGNVAQSGPQMPFPAQPSYHGMNSMAQATPISPVSQASFPQQMPFGETASGAVRGVPHPQQTSSPGAQPYMPVSQATGNQAQMPGLIQLSYATQAMSAVDTKAQEEHSQQPSNQDAKRAIINGVISFAVSILTLTTIAGFAAAIIGTFAVIYGLTGLRRARRMPDRAGRTQAIIGIVLGLLAWCIVIAAFILRAPHSS